MENFPNPRFFFVIFVAQYGRKVTPFLPCTQIFEYDLWAHNVIID